MPIRKSTLSKTLFGFGRVATLSHDFATLLWRLHLQSTNVLDLNKIWVEHHQIDNVDTGVTSAVNSDGSVTVYLRDLEDHLVTHIKHAEAVLGCVAWLTNKRILAELAKKKIVALVVQKEDFLRPDINSQDDWKSKLRQLYSRLRCEEERFNFPKLMGQLSFAGDSTVQPVRCVGNHNRSKAPASPRMHHKFVLLCTAQGEISPYAVWTGSFNFTQNAVRSLENGLLLTDPTIVSAYCDEWARVEAISEELDWTSDWAAPEWRVGT